MSKDVLNEATRALRETADVSEFEAHATRARVMSGLHQRRVRRRTQLAFLLPIAATFLAASAWGAASGQAQRAFERAERFIGLSASAPKAPGHVASVLPPKPAPAEAVIAPPSVVPPPESAALENTRANVTPIAQPSVQHPQPSGSAPAPADPSLALYRAAHTAHFVDHDPSRALAAWDAYLAAAPNGAFAPEARYNRALSLVRLDRTAEARSALEPFASGAYGAYRQSEASALLAHLAP